MSIIHPYINMKKKRMTAAGLKTSMIWLKKKTMLVFILFNWSLLRYVFQWLALLQPTDLPICCLAFWHGQGQWRGKEKVGGGGADLCIHQLSLWRWATDPKIIIQRQLWVGRGFFFGWGGGWGSIPIKMFYWNWPLTFLRATDLYIIFIIFTRESEFL